MMATATAARVDIWSLQQKEKQDGDEEDEWMIEPK